MYYLDSGWGVSPWVVWSGVGGASSSLLSLKVISFPFPEP